MQTIQHVSEVRTQIYLPLSWHRQLKEKARRQGISLAAFLRERVRDEVEEPDDIDREKAWKDLMNLAGFIKDNRSPKDMATHHGKYWAESVYKKMIKNRRKR